MTFHRALWPLSFVFAVACGGTISATDEGCPAPSPGLCPPSITCVDGFMRTGAASCVAGAWVCAQTACSDDGGATDAGADGATDAACPTTIPGLCPPSNTCVDGYQQTGGADCVDGAWVCKKEPCGEDAGSDGGCAGGLISYCNAGTIDGYCCPPGAPCATPEPYCNIGGGKCTMGTCPSGGGCTKGSISASSYDQACKSDSDCVAVYQGSACSACYCPNAAINAAAVTKYRSDFAALDPTTGICSCPVIPTPTCQAGVCTEK